MKGEQEGRSSQVSGTVWPSEWLSFVRIWRVWVGGKRGASVSIHKLTSQTWPLCRHTPPHSSRNCARQQVNTQSAHLTSQAPASHDVPNRSITEVSSSFYREGCRAGRDGKKRGPSWNCRETLINIGGDNKTLQGAAERLEWEMENKGKPQGFRKVKVLRWLCINPLLFCRTPQRPLFATSECTDAAGNTRSGASKKGCRLLMLGFSACHFTAPR